MSVSRLNFVIPLMYFTYTFVCVCFFFFLHGQKVNVKDRCDGK